MTDKPMKLLYSPRSPFVRKVMIVLEETGQIDGVALIPTTVALPVPPGDEVLAFNPLGKLPALEIETGQVIYDSRVIGEYLDARGQGGLFPTDPTARLTQLRWQALGDGLTDVLLLWRSELTRPNGIWPEVVTGWRAKTQAVMAQLEREAPGMRQTPFGIGQIAVLCALGQLDFRWPDCEWRAQFPELDTCNATWSQHGSPLRHPAPQAPSDGGDDVTAGQLCFG